jgi:pentatricopeptide repeat protein
MVPVTATARATAASFSTTYSPRRHPNPPSLLHRFLSKYTEPTAATWTRSYSSRVLLQEKKAGEPTLNSLLSRNNIEEAWSKFHGMTVSGEVKESDCYTMLNACYNSTQTKEFIEVTMAKTGVEPGVRIYNKYVSRLMVEGNVTEAERLVDEVMPSAGIEPNAKTYDALSMSDKQLSAMRTTILNRWLKGGGTASVAAAKNLFNLLVERGVANEFHFNVMMKTCDTSDQMKEMIETGEAKVGVVPNVFTYTMYVTMLMVEGNVTEAKRLVDEVMPSAGVEPNIKTYEALSMSDEHLSAIRTTILKQWVNEGGTASVAAAKNLFNSLVERGVAHQYHFSVVMKTCDTSDQMKEMIETGMAKVGVVPDVFTYNMYVKMLMIEGNVTEAERLVDEVMPSAGLEPDAKTYDALSMPDERLSAMRTSKLNKWVNEGGTASVGAAKNLFNLLVERGVADEYHFMVMEKIRNVYRSGKK